MYRSLAAFRNDAFACGNDLYPDESLKPQKLEAAYTIYQRASAGTKLEDHDAHSVDFGITIVGRLALGWEDGTWTPSDERFPSIDKIMQQNLKTMGEDPGAQGSLLGAKDWSLLANDAWVLGGVHAGTEFHFASPLRWENLLAAGGGRMTITARETICIMASGYEIVRPNPVLEAVAFRSDTAKANGASLLSLRDALLKYSDSEGLQRFFRSIPNGAKQ